MAGPPPWEQAKHSLIHSMFVECLYVLGTGGSPMPASILQGFTEWRLVRQTSPPGFPGSGRAEHGASPLKSTGLLPTAFPGCSLLFSFCQGLTSAWFNGLASCGPSQLTPGMPLCAAWASLSLLMRFSNKAMPRWSLLRGTSGLQPGDPGSVGGRGCGEGGGLREHTFLSEEAQDPVGEGRPTARLGLWPPAGHWGIDPKPQALGLSL